MSSLLLSHSEDQLRNLRTMLFDGAKTAGLAHSRDVLLRRLKRAVCPPLPTKYATGITDLCYALKNRQPVPRTLLKNGKRSATAFITSRARWLSTSSYVDSCVSSASISPVQCPDLTESAEHSDLCPASSVPLSADTPLISEELRTCSQPCGTMLTQLSNDAAPAIPCHSLP